MTPTKIIEASRTRKATKPMARLELYCLATRYSTSAVPMPVRPVMTSMRPPQSTPSALPAPRTKSGLFTTSS